MSPKQISSNIKLATVWWKDAFSHDSSVTSAGEVPNELICVSSGILLEHNDEVVKLAMDLFDIQEGQETPTYRGVGVIPNEFVVRIITQELTLTDKVSKKKNAKRQPK